MMEDNKSYASTPNVQHGSYMQYNNSQQQMPYQQYSNPVRSSMTSDAPLPTISNQHQQQHYPSHQQPLPGQAPDAPAFLAMHQQHNTHLPPQPTQAPPAAPPSTYSVSSSSPSQSQMGQMGGFYLAQGPVSSPAPAPTPAMTTYSVSSASSPRQTKAQMAGFHTSQYSPVNEKQPLPPLQSTPSPQPSAGQPSSQNLSPQQLDMVQRLQHLSPQQLEMVDRMAESEGQSGADEPPPMYDQDL